MILFGQGLNIQFRRTEKDTAKSFRFVVWKRKKPSKPSNPPNLREPLLLNVTDCSYRVNLKETSHRSFREYTVRFLRAETKGTYRSCTPKPTDLILV